MPFPNGHTYVVVPRLWAICVDYEEALQILSVRKNHCIKCLVRKEEFRVLFPSDEATPRKVNDMRGVIKLIRAADSADARNKIQRQIGIAPVTVRETFHEISSKRRPMP